MSLILIAPPKGAQQGMRDTKIIRPGGAAPLIQPHCRKCNLPVESFEVDPVSSFFYMSIEAICHGKTHGIRIPAERALKGGAIWMFTANE